MGFKFSASEVEFGYKGKEYSLPINVRLAVDLERAINMHPLTLMQKINSSSSRGEMPPLGVMAEFFEFMLKRAGAYNVTLDEIYGELFDGTDAAEVGDSIGKLLGIFIPSHEGEEVDPKPKAKRKKKTS